jgi:hypothetical protein
VWKKLLDFVQEGASAEIAARQLVYILRREAQQRERLQARLATRAFLPADVNVISVGNGCPVKIENEK